MARLYRAHAGEIVLGLLVLLTAWWNVTYNGSAYNDRSSVPPDVDAFLSAVRAATPPHARLLVADTWQDNVMFVRALYMLVPRRLFLLRVTPAEVRRGALSLSWAEIRRRARRDGARYVALYALPRPDPKELHNGWLAPAIPRGVIPPSAVRLRVGKGLLVDVGP